MVLPAGAAGCVGRDQSRPARLVERDDAGQRPRAIRSSAGTANDFGAGNVLGRKCTPDDPATERIVLRHAIQHHQGTTRARRGNRAQRYALRRRVGREAAVAAKEREARHLRQGGVELGSGMHRLLIEPHEREGITADGIGRPRGHHDRFQRLGPCRQPADRQHRGGQEDDFERVGGQAHGRGNYRLGRPGSTPWRAKTRSARRERSKAAKMQRIHLAG